MVSIYHVGNQDNSLTHLLDDVLYEEGNTIEDDAMLGLDHMDRTRTNRNGAEMFLK